jgi:hypothetical protein
MKNARIGFLTPPGLVASGLTTLIVFAFAVLRGGAMFSPGVLNDQANGTMLGGYASHAEFADQCSLCHAPLWDAAGMSGRCETCHTDIASQRSDPATLHGIIFQMTPDIACQTCHTDHRGPSASMTDFDSRLFPHFVFGYSLAGHAALPNGSHFACSDCHGSDITTFDLATCQTCHEQLDAAFTTVHVLSFGTDCLACHDGIDTFGSDFDHNRFLFDLTGKHVGAPCSACHLNARTVPDLQAAPTDCFSCHAEDEPHEGRFGTDCGSCHTTDGWKPASFDHNLAAFKLEGKHAQVECESCHINGVYRGTPMDCYSCHAQDDVHMGSFGTQCGNCHNPAGWLPAFFDHNLSSFPLTGAHVRLACDQCHGGGMFNSLSTDCYSCHAANDAHNGQYGTNCAACHTTSGWKPAFFDHNLSSFPLTGAHVGLACDQCHGGGVFNGLSTDCYSCHAANDAHNGQYGTNCAACHTTSGWKPAFFDHNFSSFPLTGAHVGLACTQCHGGDVFNGLSTACASCHAEPTFHAGFFSDTACSQCHSTSSWRPASFNRSHSADCDGQCINHEGATCRDCHSPTLSTHTCTKCHDSNNPKDGGDD